MKTGIRHAYFTHSQSAARTQTYYEHLLEVQQAYASRLVRRQPTPRLSVK